jgi:CO dehydrogenase nickel-insertion accessory protein CooC1
MIEINVTGESGTGINTMASHIAVLLYDQGFDVVVNSSDEINAELVTKEKLQKLKNDTIISVCVSQVEKNQESI